MCGIVGFCGAAANHSEQLRKMCDCIISRGPDGQGYWSEEDGSVSLGHRRLSIIDLSEGGSQPMISSSGRYVISYNGEIYNFPQLRKELIGGGYVSSFHGTSDTEILLEAFEAYGLQAIQKAKGMFALALYDRHKKTLHLMRDRTGEKPLYYGYVGSHFVFASELSAIKAFEGFDASIDRNALRAYLQYKSVPQPLSIYQGIYKLLPGYILSMQAPYEQATFSQYYSYETMILSGLEDPYQGSFEEATDDLEELLLQAVSGQMLSDVPIGAFLSGGIDSPLVVSMMQQLAGSPVKTFTIGFEDPNYNEATYAKEIAKHLGTSHQELYISNKELEEVVPLLPSILSEPIADPACLPGYLVSKMARREVTVTLSGDAGDELFCGYGIYNQLCSLQDKLGRIPTPLRRLSGQAIRHTPLKFSPKLYNLAEYCLPESIYPVDTQVNDLLGYHELYRREHSLLANTLVITDHPSDHYMDVLKANGDSRLLPDLSDYRSGKLLSSLDDRSRMLYRDQTGFMTDTVLHKVDRTGMAVSLENRIPLLDADILAFSWRLPIEYKTHQGEDKRILKNLLYRHVPRSLLDRQKHGFEVPLKTWLSPGGALYDWAGDLITQSTLVADGYLHKSAVHTLWNHHCKKQTGTLQLWYVLQAEAWYRKQHERSNTQ